MGVVWAASTVSSSDNKIRDSLKDDGIRVVTFPSLLKWNTAPVTQILQDILEMGEQSLGCPVEIEFAINLNQNEDRKHEFCLLQIKPMVVGGLDKVKIGEPSKADDVICTSSVALGNGALKDIKNIIFIDPKMFDASKSMQIAKEIEKMNALIDDDEKYILIGPGRWGLQIPG